MVSDNVTSHIINQINCRPTAALYSLHLFLTSLKWGPKMPQGVYLDLPSTPKLLEQAVLSADWHAQTEISVIGKEEQTPLFWKLLSVGKPGRTGPVGSSVCLSCWCRGIILFQESKMIKMTRWWQQGKMHQSKRERGFVLVCVCVLQSAWVFQDPSSLNSLMCLDRNLWKTVKNPTAHWRALQKVCVCMCLNLHAAFLFHLCGWKQIIFIWIHCYGAMRHVLNLFFQYTYLDMNSKITFNSCIHLQKTEQRPPLYFQLSDLKDLNLQWNQHGGKLHSYITHMKAEHCANISTTAKEPVPWTHCNPA